MNESRAQNQPEQYEKDGRIIKHAIGTMAVVGRLPDQMIDETIARSNEAPVKIDRVIETMRNFAPR